MKTTDQGVNEVPDFRTVPTNRSGTDPESGVNDLPDYRQELLPADFLQRWQEMTNLLAALLHVPAVLIMRYETSTLEVYLSSKSPGNPYRVGEKSHWSGLYCKAVVQSQEYLMIPNALKDPLWDKNPDLAFGMIAYLGFPVNYPDGTPFGTLCVLDRKETNFPEQTIQLLRHFRDTLQNDLATIVQEKTTTKIEMNVTDHDLATFVLQPREDNFATKTDPFFFSLYSHISDAIFFIDGKSSRVIAANKAACEIYGYNEGEFTQLSIRDIDYQYDEKKVSQIIEELYRNGKAMFEVTHKTRNGKLLDVEVKVVLLQKKFILAIARDITKRKEDERRLNDLNNAKDVFLNLLSHDIKGSMNVILNYAELLVGRHQLLESGQLEEYYREVHTTAQNASRLLDNLLLWTQLKSQKIPVIKGVFQAKNIIRDILYNVQPAILQKGLSCIDLPVDNEWVKADSTLFSKVMSMLIVNAVNYSPTHGEVKIIRSIVGSFLRIEIADQGMGILANFKDVVFSIEHVLNNRDSLNDPATGLSLVICRELIELNGGEIVFQGEPGKGTLISFTVPLASELEVAEVFNEIKRETH